MTDWTDLHEAELRRIFESGERSASMIAARFSAAFPDDPRNAMLVRSKLNRMGYLLRPRPKREELTARGDVRRKALDDARRAAEAARPKGPEHPDAAFVRAMLAARRAGTETFALGVRKDDSPFVPSSFARQPISSGIGSSAATCAEEF